MSSPRRSRSASLLLCLLGCLTAVTPAAAQSCPGGYSACDYDGCCPSSAQCCPTLAEGCCDSATPFCCGDGSCAASPAECGNIGRTSCGDYDIPCGEGCAPAGSQCCDLAGHYCPPQGVCASETTCLAGTVAGAALLVVTASVGTPQATTIERSVSPLLNPPDGTERSCAMARPTTRGVEGLAPVLLLVGAALLRRTLRTRRSTCRL